MEMSKQSQEKIGQLQLIEQNMQNLLVQKQNYQSQLFETESALKELESKTSAYKIIGNIMVASDPKDLKKDLEKSKEMLNLRLSSLEKQEGALKEKANLLQADILKDIKK